MSYSAKVVLTLIVGDRKLALSHVGSRMIVIRDPCQPLPACDAQLCIQVDDQFESLDVFLPHGISGPEQEITYL